MHSERLKHIMHHDSVLKLIFKFSGSAIISTTVVAIYTATDQIILGRTIGEFGLSIVGIVSPFIFLISTVGIILKVGSSSILAQKLGHNKFDEAQDIVRNIYAFSIILGIIFAIIGLFFSETITILAGANNNNPELLQAASQFIQILLIGCVFILPCSVTETFLRAYGKPLIALWFIIITCLINLGLDILFVVYMKTSASGAALATVISQIVGCIFAFFYLQYSSIKLTYKKFTFNKAVIWESFKIGSAFGISDIVLAITFFVCNWIITSQATNVNTYLANMSIIMGCVSLLYLPVAGIGEGIQPTISYNFAAGNTKRCYQIIRETFGFLIATMSIIFVIIMVFPEFFIQLFLPEGSSVSASSIQMLRLGFLSQPMIGILIGTTGSMAAMGDEKNIRLSILPLFIQIPLILIIPYFFPLEYIAISFAISESICALLSLIFFANFLKEKNMFFKNIISKE